MAKRKVSARQELIDGLNEDLNLELEAVLRYLYHSAAATGLLGHELREELKGDIQGELSHAVFLSDKITALGGELHINPTMPKKVSNRQADDADRHRGGAAGHRQLYEAHRAGRGVW